MKLSEKVLPIILLPSICALDGNMVDSFKDPQAKAILRKMQKNNTDILKLETLQIDNAQIVYLDGFEQLKSLKSLSLSGNLIKNIGSVARLNALKNQNLSKNQIQYANCLLGLNNLEFLNLSHNHLKYAFCCSFQAIRQLDISHNEIQQLIFSDKCDLLESIDISFNPLTQIAIKAGLPSLKKFYTDSTLIRELKPFFKLNNLESLSLSNCIQLKSIDGLFRQTNSGLECALPKLKSLTISEEFLDNKSKDLLEKIKAGKLNRPFTLNNILISGEGSNLSQSQQNISL